MNDSVNSTFRRSTLGAGLVAAAILAGCSSPAVTPPDPTGGAAGGNGGGMTPSAGPTPGKDEFLTKVYPLLDSCAGCHITGVQGAPKYMGNDAASSYDTIRMFARIFKKSADSSLPSKMDHAGATVKDDVRAASKAWLDKEFPGAAPVEEPGMTAPPVGNAGGVGFNAAMAEFIRCMRQDDWEQNMKFYPMVQTNTLGPCAGCHEDGNAGTFLNADFNDTFDAMKTIPYVYRLVSPIYEKDAISDLAPNDRLITKGQITTDCFDPNNLICHDTYNVPKVQSQGLKFFQNSTLGRMDGLKCGEI